MSDQEEEQQVRIPRINHNIRNNSNDLFQFGGNLNFSDGMISHCGLNAGLISLLSVIFNFDIWILNYYETEHERYLKDIALEEKERESKIREKRSERYSFRRYISIIIFQSNLIFLSILFLSLKSIADSSEAGWRELKNADGTLTTSIWSMSRMWFVIEPRLSVLERAAWATISSPTSISSPRRESSWRHTKPPSR